MSAVKGLLIGALSAALVLLIFFGIKVYQGQTPAREQSRVVDASITIGGPFTLVDQTGATVTDEDFRGRPMLVFFGFTYCPDVCPFTMQALAQALDQLGDDGDIFQTVFISVDPERDTPEQLASYVASNGFPENVVGLTGSPDAIRAAADAYRADYDVIADDPNASDYLIEHTSVVYLMDADGRFVEPFTHASTPDEIATRLRNYLDRGGRPRATG